MKTINRIITKTIIRKSEDYKTISYLEKLQKYSLIVSNSEFLDLTSKAKECVEHELVPKQKSIGY